MSEQDRALLECLRKWGQESEEAAKAFFSKADDAALLGLLNAYVDRSRALRKAWAKVDEERGSDGQGLDEFVWDMAFSFACAAVRIADELCRRWEFEK